MSSRFSALLSLSSRMSGVICAPFLHCSTAQNYCVARSEGHKNKCVMSSGNCGTFAKNIYLDNNNKRHLNGEKMIRWVVSYTFNIEQFSIKWNITLTCQLTCKHDKPFTVDIYCLVINWICSRDQQTYFISIEGSTKSNNPDIFVHWCDALCYEVMSALVLKLN